MGEGDQQSEAPIQDIFDNKEPSTQDMEQSDAYSLKQVNAAYQIHFNDHIQEQIDALHQKDRADWKRMETIVSSSVASLRHEIAQLKSKYDDQEMTENKDESQEVTEHSGGDHEITQNDHAPQSASPLSDIQGDGACLEDLTESSHQNSTSERTLNDTIVANWKLNKVIMATKLKSLQVEVAQLKDREAGLLSKLEELETHETNRKHIDEKLQYQIDNNTLMLTTIECFKDSLRQKLNVLWSNTVSKLETFIDQKPRITRSRMSSMPRDSSGTTDHRNIFFKADFWDWERTFTLLQEAEALNECD